MGLNAGYGAPLRGESGEGGSGATPELLRGEAASAFQPLDAASFSAEAVLDAEKNYIDTPALDLVGRMHGRGWYTRTNDRVDVPRYTAAEWAALKASKA